MPSFYSSSYSDDRSAATSKLLGHRRTLHATFGGGRVADVILWRNKNLSVAILVLASVLWFLLQIGEYPLLSLVCHISIVAMLIIFIWSNGATAFHWPPPKIPKVISSQIEFKEAAGAFHSKLTRFTSTLHDTASGKDLKLFLLVIAFLWILSAIGMYFSFTNILYLGFLCIQTLPALYERYEEDMDYFAYKGTNDMKKLYRKFDSNVLDKIPRGPRKKLFK